MVLGPHKLLIALWLFFYTFTTGMAAPQSPKATPGEQGDGRILVTNNQVLTPVGMVRRIEGARPKDLALSPDGKTLAVLATNRVVFWSAEGNPQGEVPLPAGALGIAWSPDGRAVFVSGGNGRIYRLVREENWKSEGDWAVEVKSTGPQEGVRSPGNPQVGGLAVSPDGRRLYIALGIRNAVAVMDLPEMKLSSVVPVGVAPYDLILSKDGRTLLVANRGGRRVNQGEKSTALSAGTPVRVDPATDAARRGSLSIIDTRSLTAMEIEVGRQPSGMALSADGERLYIANSDGDTVSVVDTRRQRVTGAISVRPPEDPGFGQIPTDAALSSDGQTLYVACGGGNAVAVIRLQPAPRLEGYLPGGWFPIAVAERDGLLFLASAKGIGGRLAGKTGRFGVHDSVGTVQFIAPEDRSDLPALTRQVAANNRWGPELPPRKGIAPVPVPERVGEPSFFKYVVYIIKENLTYDTVLGDMPEGNGDPSLTLFGEEVSPNHHALARQFVLMDNTYTSGTNSADGHQWVSSSVANGYIEQNYAAHTRSYPYDGGDPLAYSPAGFLWNAARRKKISLRVYGEFVNKPRIEGPSAGKNPTWQELWEDYRTGANRFRITADTDNASLKPFLHPRYIGFPTLVSDQWRADQFLDDLAHFESTGRMPSLSILLLPNNHTTGTRPGFPTPRASVADNDLALGRIVDKLSHSRFWKEMLILVIEDDSQTGLDHVDGHRTAAFCISPYTRRGEVIGEFYNHPSFVRTIGLVLGMPPLNRFDRTATPLAACFTGSPDFRPYTHLPNRIALDEMNPPLTSLKGEDRRWAAASLRLDWSDVDRADAGVVARALWHSRNPERPFPWHSFKKRGE